MKKNSYLRFDLSFKAFHELMAKRVRDILLVSSPYDAFIMEEEGRLAERIIHEYRGLNLTSPPRLTVVATARKAKRALSEKAFDLVITMPRLDDMDPYQLGRDIKKQNPQLPVVFLSYDSGTLLINPKYLDQRAIDWIYIWLGNSDLLLALVKITEDRWNVAYDTERAKVRVILFVEDTPLYYSSLLPFLYKVVVKQTQRAMDESINEEHRILRMRARPKILIAKNYEEAEEILSTYASYLMCAITDVRFPRKGKVDKHAGFALLTKIRDRLPYLPILMLSSESTNQANANAAKAAFINKSDSSLRAEIQAFFQESVGFGEFTFRMPDGREVARAANLKAMSKILPSIPDDSIFYHAQRNDFSSWLFARSEMDLAINLRAVKASDFLSPQEIRNYLTDFIIKKRKGRQKGVVTDFIADDFDSESDFIKIGKGFLGGKARGLAFLSTLLGKKADIRNKFKNITLSIPKTAVISTDGFDQFILENQIKGSQLVDLTEEGIERIFIQSRFPEQLEKDLSIFLEQVNYPLAIRSSSLMEDAHARPCAGLFKTLMIPNSHKDLKVRLKHLIHAVKLVYASTFRGRSSFAIASSQQRPEEDKMAVIIQQIAGHKHNDFFYPAISGVAQSYNFYPVGYMQPEEGVAHICLGFGKIVVEGGISLRFSPKYPQILPQFSSVEATLKNAQKKFYLLKLNSLDDNFGLADASTLISLDVDEAIDHLPVKRLAGTYYADDHKLRDGFSPKGYPVLTFAEILKHGTLPLPQVLSELLKFGRKGMGGPVEIEFAVNFDPTVEAGADFSILQIRPMAKCQQGLDIELNDADLSKSFCSSSQAMGFGQIQTLNDIIWVKPNAFDPGKTPQIAMEISKLNAGLINQRRKYLLIGPGRWGSADHWLGIPVAWSDISGVATIVEASIDKLQADPSQGTHFFHNITSMGINYLTITNSSEDYVDWQWLEGLAFCSETGFVRHTHLEAPISIKIDAKSSRAVLIKPSE